MHCVHSSPYQHITQRFLSLGSIGWAYQIDDEIALKYPRHSQSDAFVHEKTIYDTFERHHRPCPHVVQSFYHTELCIFIQYILGGSLLDRLQNNQTRDKDKVVSVTGLRIGA